jgi:thiosulfate dehydrogenase
VLRLFKKTNRNLCRFSILIVLSALATSEFQCNKKSSGEESNAADSIAIVKSNMITGLWVAPDSVLIMNEPNADLILYGKSLLAHTSEYFGPNGSIAHSTNGMNCQNCHMYSGTKPFGNNYGAVYSTYPKFRARSGTLESIVKRVNDCFERSLNGNKIDSTSHEMQAIIAYITWLGKDVPKGETPKGTGVIELKFLDRAADPHLGKVAYEKKCITCHGLDGQGKLSVDGKSFTYPPLWGPNSYNVSAGLYRLSRLAGFIKGNMPYGTTYLYPQLSDSEAWDIAAYVCSMDRPQKKFSGDWPDVSKKPVDYPFGPYADAFSEQQHKYGPFEPIQAFYKTK